MEIKSKSFAKSIETVTNLHSSQNENMEKN